MDKPVLYEIKGGWAAASDGWAVHGETKEQALDRFHETKRLFEEALKRPPFYQQPRVLNAQF